MPPGCFAIFPSLFAQATGVATEISRVADVARAEQQVSHLSDNVWTGLLALAGIAVVQLCQLAATIYTQWVSKQITKQQTEDLTQGINEVKDAAQEAIDTPKVVKLKLDGQFNDMLSVLKRKAYLEGFDAGRRAKEGDKA